MVYIFLCCLSSVYFVDGGFAPESAFSRSDTSSTSLLVSILAEINRYRHEVVAENLYEPFNKPMLDMIGNTIFVNHPETFQNN
ncbi:MAG: hypothetical protein F6K17_00220 [Okeania sp. SIO3C4]|nr:hypothetical protein [Okeania sp. SIO3C4]